MKVVVFGGSGFLGSHVCDKLSNVGHDVTIYDIEESRYRAPEQRIIIGNILDEEKVRQSVADKDVVFNFSGLSDIETNTQRPIDAVKTNVLGNSILLEAARSADIKRYVFASSAYVLVVQELYIGVVRGHVKTLLKTIKGLLVWSIRF